MAILGHAASAEDGLGFVIPGQLVRQLRVYMRYTDTISYDYDNAELIYSS